MGLGIGMGIGLDNNVAAQSGGGGGTATAFNSSDKSANITLTNGNKTATLGTAAIGGTRSTASIAGKKYVEFHIDSNVSTDVMVGITESTSNLGAWLYNASGAHSVMFYLGSLIYNNGGSTSTGLGNAIAGNVIQFAIDEPNNLLWVGKNNSYFGNPSAGTGGLDISLMTKPIYGVLQSDGSGDAVTGFGTTYSPPTGFSYL